MNLVYILALVLLVCLASAKVERRATHRPKKWRHQ